MDRKLKIAVIFGGCSPEYPVSLESAHSVIVNLDREKYEPVLLGITRGGEWFRFLGGAVAPPLAAFLWHAAGAGVPYIVAGASVVIAAACILLGRKTLAHVDGAHPDAADEGAAVLIGDAA